MKVLKKEELVPTLYQLFSRAKEKVFVVSAWIRGSIFKELLSLLPESIELEVIVRARNLSDMDITDEAFFRETKKKNGKIFLNPKLHSKFLVIDEKYALVGSSNITFMGLYPEGNVETNVLIDEEDKIKELLEFYEELKRNSVDYTDVVGYVVSSRSPKEAEVILLEDVKEQTYLGIWGEEFFLCRLSNVSGKKEPKEDALGRILSSEVFDWKVSALFAHLYEKPELKTGKLEILGEYERDRNLFKTPTKGVEPGALVKKLEPESEELKRILFKNHSGYDMKYPTYLGKLYDTGVKAYLDMDKVLGMHMAVLGTTGSGKTTFVKKILKNFKESEVIIFDIYGEYSRELNAKEVILKNVLFPISVDDVKDYLREAGSTLEERSTEEKEFFSVFRRALKPDLESTELKQKSLKELYEEALKNLHSLPLKQDAQTVYEHLERTYSKEALELQPKVLKEVSQLLNSEERVKVFNFKEVDITETKVNLIGLILKEVFIRAKKDRKPRLVVVEEAQNVAPEKGTGDVPSGKENVAFIYTKKIAMEGRKLNLGLIAITQRPANLSKFILSQLNTQVIFKLITKNDLDAVSPFFEYSKEDIFRLLPFLKPGTAFISGLAVPFSFLFQMEEIPYY